MGMGKVRVLGRFRLEQDKVTREQNFRRPSLSGLYEYRMDSLRRTISLNVP